MNGIANKCVDIGRFSQSQLFDNLFSNRVSLSKELIKICNGVL